MFFRICISLLTAVLLGGCVSTPGKNQETTLGTSQVEILSPAPDAMVDSSSVEVVFRFLKGRKDGGEHIHLYLDGEKWGIVKASPVTLNRLAPGPHAVVLEVLTMDHQSLNIRANVHFIVRGPER
jgi:hypothetical protein